MVLFAHGDHEMDLVLNHPMHLPVYDSIRFPLIALPFVHDESCRSIHVDLLVHLRSNLYLAYLIVFDMLDLNFVDLILYVLLDFVNFYLIVHQPCYPGVSFHNYFPPLFVAFLDVLLSFFHEHNHVAASLSLLLTRLHLHGYQYVNFLHCYIVLNVYNVLLFLQNSWKQARTWILPFVVQHLHLKIFVVLAYLLLELVAAAVVAAVAAAAAMAASSPCSG